MLDLPVFPQSSRGVAYMRCRDVGEHQQSVKVGGWLALRHHSGVKLSVKVGVSATSP